MMSEATTGKNGPLKYDRRIIVVTDGQGSMDTDDLSGISAKVKSDGVELTLLYVWPLPDASLED